MRSRCILLMSLALLSLAGAAGAQGDSGQKYRILYDRDRFRGPYRSGGKIVYDVTFQVKVLGEETGDSEGDVVVITEDGKEAHRLPLRQVRTADLSIVLVVDVSGSMALPEGQPKIDALKAAVNQFVDKMPPQARATVVPFSTEVLSPEPFTTTRGSREKEQLKERVRSLQAAGGTRLYDAALAGVETLAAARPPGKRFVVVLTDGIDEDPGSRHGPEDVITRAKEEKITLFVVGLGPRGKINEDVLKQMALDTGGKYIPVENATMLEEIYKGLAVELQSTYSVTFPSVRQSMDGTVRGIDIKVVDQQGRTRSNVAQENVATFGLVVPEFDYGVYLVLFALLLALLTLPAGLRRLTRSPSA